jgi:hypothetical protein
MKIETRRLDSIRPYERNPRRNDPAVAAVAASLREFGFRQPIVVDAAGVIITGHTTYRAAKKLGLQHVPVHVAADLTPQQAQAYRLADNKTADLAEWDDAKLTAEILALSGQGMDLAQFGFPAPDAPDAGEGDVGGTSSGGGGDTPGAGIEILRCTFTAKQLETVKKALDKATKAGPFGPTGNGNVAGNALARICEVYRED